MGRENHRELNRGLLKLWVRKVSVGGVGLGRGVAGNGSARAGDGAWLARENHRELNWGLLELWVNQVRIGWGWDGELPLLDALTCFPNSSCLPTLIPPQQVLDPGSADLTGRTEPLKYDTVILKGLASFGLTRPELRNAGLSDPAIDRVYRGLYVYTIGFFDVMQVWGDFRGVGMCVGMCGGAFGPGQ